MATAASKASKDKKAHREWPVVAYVGIFGGAFLGYAIARIALYLYPHPYHWAGGLVGALLGCGGGWLWFRQRGDII